MPTMHLGAVLPQTEIGHDVAAVRAFATGVEELGLEHLLAYEHVLGVDRDRHPGWSGPYDLTSTFHEPLVLFGHLAALTSRIALVTGVLVLAQRPTALVAKQAAEVDLLSGGRLRLGVGVGWNVPEIEALGYDASQRGRRMDEQVELLRRLWTERSVTFEGEHEHVRGLGIAPLPVQRPVPLWIGGSSLPAYRRIGRLADGWFPQVAPGPALDAALAVVAEHARAAGRDPAVIGMHARAAWRGDAVRLAERAAQWRGAGATHLALSTAGAGPSAEAHLAALAEAAAVVARAA